MTASSRGIAAGPGDCPPSDRGDQPQYWRMATVPSALVVAYWIAQVCFGTTQVCGAGSGVGVVDLPGGIPPDEGSVRMALYMLVLFALLWVVALAARGCAVCLVTLVGAVGLLALQFIRFPYGGPLSLDGSPQVAHVLSHPIGASAYAVFLGAPVWLWLDAIRLVPRPRGSVHPSCAHSAVAGMGRRRASALLGLSAAILAIVWTAWRVGSLPSVVGADRALDAYRAMPHLVRIYAAIAVAPILSAVLVVFWRYMASGWLTTFWSVHWTTVAAVCLIALHASTQLYRAGDLTGQQLAGRVASGAVVLGLALAQVLLARRIRDAMQDGS